MCSCTSLLGHLLWDMPDFSKKNNSFSSLSCHGSRKICCVSTQRQTVILAGREWVEVQSLLGEKAIAQGLPVCRVTCFLLQPTAADIPRHSTPEIIFDLLWSFQSIHRLFLDAWGMHNPHLLIPASQQQCPLHQHICNCPERKKDQRKCDRAPSSPWLCLPTSFVNWVMIITSLEIYLISPSGKKNQEVWLWQAIRGYSADEQLPITKRAVGTFNGLDLSNGLPEGWGPHHSNQSSSAPLRRCKWSRRRSAAIDQVGGHENGFR